MNVYSLLDLAFEAPIWFRHLGRKFSYHHLKTSDLLIKVWKIRAKIRLVRLKQKIRSKQIERDREESLACIAITLSYLQHEHFLLLDMTLEAPVLFSC